MLGAQPFCYPKPMWYYSVKIYFRDYWILPSFLAGLVCLLISWYYVAHFIGPTSDQIFLHYNVIFGVDWAGEWWKMFYMPFGGTLIFLINIFLSQVFFTKDKISARILTVLTAGLMAGILSATVLLVNLNI